MLKEELTCFICYSIFHKPNTLKPCGHTFCDPCIRKTVKASLEAQTEIHNWCQYCRTKILGCTENKLLALKIKEMYEGEYYEREKEEVNCKVYTVPLPPITTVSILRRDFTMNMNPSYHLYFNPPIETMIGNGRLFATLSYFSKRFSLLLLKAFLIPSIISLAFNIFLLETSRLVFTKLQPIWISKSWKARLSRGAFFAVGLCALFCFIKIIVKNPAVSESVFGQFHQENSENFDGIMFALGMGYMNRLFFYANSMFIPLVTIKRNGKNGLTFKEESLLITNTFSCQFGVPFEQTVFDDRKVNSLVYLVEPNIIKHEMRGTKGEKDIECILKFSENQLSIVCRVGDTESLSTYRRLPLQGNNFSNRYLVSKQDLKDIVKKVIEKVM